jgi:hypothetical protein
VDFDALDHDGRYRISLRFRPAPRPPRPGEHIYLADAGGRGCVGTVERVKGWHAWVRPDWATWAAGRAA